MDQRIVLLGVTEHDKTAVYDPVDQHQCWFLPFLNSSTESFRTEKFYPPPSGCVGFCIH